MRRHLFAIAAVPLAALALAGCSVGSASEPGPAPTAAKATTTPVTSPNCPDAFTATLLPDPTGTPGIHYIDLVNTGQTSCELTGFPDITLIGPADEPTGRPAETDVDDRGRTPVTVEPNGHAYAWIHLVESENGHADCTSPAQVSALSLRVPEASEPVTIDYSFTACADSPLLAQIQIGPVDSEPRSPSRGY
ncbi:DUF4232 domain-containing protein [Plantibacter sp. YIM 135249]|uniref:DUF4232 domain-containing protein n=1 Tax=Plantibacter sp. YIM 135249 TaxID=3423918 RepID=UPI003D3511A7